MAADSPQAWDFFLAHAGVDSAPADALYAALSPHARVFLDERNLIPGDRWSRVLPAVLRRSRVIVVLVSANTHDAWYADSEIRLAIDLVREFPDRYRVIALLLDDTAPIRRTDLPYGLEQTVLVSLAKSGGWPQVVQRLLDALRAEPARPDADELTARPSRPAPLVDSTTAFVGETRKGATRPLLITSWEEYVKHFGAPLPAERSFLATAVRGFFENGGERAYVARVLAAEATRAMFAIPTQDPAQQLVAAARSLGDIGNWIQLHLQPGSRTGLRLQVELFDESWAGQGVLEDFDNLSILPGKPNPLLEVINNRSEWITLEWRDPQRAPSPTMTGIVRFGGGTDGNASRVDYLGTQDLPAHQRTSLAALELLDDVGVLCCPDAAHPRFTIEDRIHLVNAIVAQCERQMCFGILGGETEFIEDMPDTQWHTQPRAPVDSACVATYWPWIEVQDAAENKPVLVPAVGHVAGAFARHDREHGVQVSPELELHGVIRREPTGPELLRQANASTIDEYARRGVNLIGRDPANAQRLVLASAITTSIDETWRAIGVRRLFNYVERSLRAVLAWAPTAPMAEATWAQAREEVESFLMRLWRAGMLAGNSPEEAFFVRCDPSTMTQDDILNGRLILAIGVNAKDRSLQFPQPPVMQIPLQRSAAPLQ